jgi:hypothetical protein
VTLAFSWGVSLVILVAGAILSVTVISSALDGRADPRVVVTLALALMWASSAALTRMTREKA